MLFLIIFTLTLAITVTISIKKKTYLYLFFPLILFLPSYYSIELSSSLPLISATRILYVVLFIYTFFTYKADIIKNIRKVEVSIPLFLFATYFILRTISNLYYSTKYISSLKTIFLLLFEELSLLLIAYLINLSLDMIIQIIKFIVYCSAAIFTLAIIESYSYFRIFDYLYTAKRFLGNEHYIRLGLMRSTVTANFACSFGNLCLLLFPLVIFMYDYTKQRRYLIICILNIFAVIHSGTRSSMLFMIFLCFLELTIQAKEKARLKLFTKNAISILIVILTIMSVCSIFSSKCRYYYVGTGKSLLNEVGFNFDLDKDAPDSTSGYGSNSNGTASRTKQFSAVAPALKQNALFGLGSGAFTRQEVYFNTGDSYAKLKNTDVGIVLVSVEEGLLGVIAYISLFAALLLILFKNFSFKHFICNINTHLMVEIVAFLLGTLTTTGQNYYLFTLAFLIIASASNSKSSRREN